MNVLMLPCSMKNCGNYARVETNEALPAEFFVLCNDCEDAVALQVMGEIEATGALPEKFTLEFAQVLNAWRRKRKGATFPHRRLTITMTRGEAN